MPIVLRCTDGPCAGQTITVESELVLGRTASEQGRLGGDARLSRHHARVFVDPAGRATVEDLGSTNGTWINEQQLRQARIVSSGDVLRVGQTTFEVEVSDGPPATPEHREAPDATRIRTRGPRLLVAAGPRQGEEIPLTDVLELGRSFGEPGALGGDRRLSRRHARIARGPGGSFFIEDIGSSNGTRINHEPLRRARSLRAGDQIEVGSSRLEALGLPEASLAADLGDAPRTATALAGAPSPGAPELAPFQGAAAPLPGPPAPPHGPPAPPYGPPAPPPGPPASPPGAPRLPAGWPAAPGSAAREAPAATGAPSGSEYVPQGAAGGRLSARRGRVVGLFAAVFAVAAIVAVAAVVLLTPLGTRTCPSGFTCQRPLTAPPLRAMTTFTGSLGWRIEYDPQLAVPARGTKKANGITLGESAAYDRLLGLSSGAGAIGVLVRGYRTRQVTARGGREKLATAIDSSLVGTVAAPSSDQLFGVPTLGFHPAVGEVLEGNVRTPQGPGALVKVAVLSAASGGVTVAVAIVYPVQQGRTQGDNPDQPFDQFGDQILGTVRFPSDGVL